MELHADVRMVLPVVEVAGLGIKGGAGEAAGPSALSVDPGSRRASSEGVVSRNPSPMRYSSRTQKMPPAESHTATFSHQLSMADDCVSLPGLHCA